MVDMRLGYLNIRFWEEYRYLVTFTHYVVISNLSKVYTRLYGSIKRNGNLTPACRNINRQLLPHEISRQFPGIAASQLRILEAGTGPGFFAILLCELGYDVTAIDLTPAMLEEAKKNAGSMSGSIRFMEMNAEALDFEDASFDVVISRNLTWNLPHPNAAYAEWVRVLRPGGLLLNFDANWYAYLFDEKAQAAYDQDRINSAERGVWDQNVGENFDVMEDIARRVPLSSIRRPAWDLAELRSLGLHVRADERIWQRVWSEEEKLNFSSTPLFMVRAIKE